MAAMAPYVRQYAKEHGRYPSNDGGLPAVPRLVEACRRQEHSYSSGLFLCRVRPSGILTRWGDPFVYENRRGLPASKFADSGATLDQDHKYSIKIDDGIYIWSIGAEQAYNEFRYWRIRIYIWQFLIVVAVLGLIALFVRASVLGRAKSLNVRARWTDGTGPAVAGFMLSVILPLLVSPAFMATCYRMSTVRRRDEPLDRSCRALLARYHQRGIISDVAYRKMLTGLDRDILSPR